MSPFSEVKLLLITVVSGLYQVIHCTVVLSPRGNEFICGRTNASISRTLTCNVSETYLRWDISIMGNTPTLHFFDDNQLSSQAPYNVSGIIASLTAITSNVISSALVIPNNRSLLPVAIKCGFSSSNQLTYSLMSKDPPDPPTNVSAIKNCGVEEGCMISWQPSASSASEDKSVEQYLLTITSVSDPSHTRTLTTANTSIFLHLNDATNYTVSLKASNCAGDSSEVFYGITRDLNEPAPQASTAITIIGTLLFETSGSTRASSNLWKTMSLHTFATAQTITSDSDLITTNEYIPDNEIQFAVIGALVAVIFILVMIVTVMAIGIIICCKRFLLRAKSSNTSNFQPKLPIYEDIKEVVDKGNVATGDNMAYGVVPASDLTGSVEENVAYTTVGDTHF